MTAPVVEEKAARTLKHSCDRVITRDPFTAWIKKFSAISLKMFFNFDKFDVMTQQHLPSPAVLFSIQRQNQRCMSVFVAVPLCPLADCLFLMDH
jgi:hypothetical protein